MAIVTYPHGPMVQLASNAWVVSAHTSQGIDRKMTVARGRDGSLFLHDALWLNDAAFSELDALGPVRTILVPSFLHDFDLMRYGERYPDAKMVAFPGTLKRLKWSRLEPFTPSAVPEGITVTQLPGLRMHECMAEISHPEGGVTQVYCDAMFNMPHGKGFKGWVFKTMGSTGPLHMTLIGRVFLLRNRSEFKAFLAAQAARDDIRHVVVGHGRVVSGNAAEMLRGAAEQL